MLNAKYLMTGSRDVPNRSSALRLGTADTPPTLDSEPLLSQGGDSLRVKGMFRLLDTGMKCFWGILIQHRNALLGENGTCVDTLIDQVDGASGDLDPIIQRLLPRFQPGKGGQERRMNVNYPVLKDSQKLAFQNTHKASQNHQVHLRLAQGRDARLFRFGIEFGAELTRRDVLRGNSTGSGGIQDAGLSDIADDEHDFQARLSGGAGLSDGHEIGAFSRSKHAQAAFPLSLVLFQSGL
jgi:hypothetical protein